MVIAVAAFGLALHPDRQAVGTGIGSAAPTPRRAPEAEEFLAAALDDDGLWESRGAAARRPGRRVRRPGRRRRLPDRRRPRHRARTALHALSVMARRALAWAWNDFRRG